MAANTPVTLTLTAKDWELLIGIIFHSSDSDMIDIYLKLNNLYSTSNPFPGQNQNINIDTTEETIIKIATYLYGNTVRNIAKDSGANPFSRIMTILRNSNNVADNYINTEFTTLDGSNQNNLQSIRKNGRLYIMNKIYDNN